MRKIYLYVVLLFFIVLNIFAEVTLSVDKRDLSIEDRLELNITIKGGQGSGDIAIANLEDSWEVQSAGSSSRMTIVNGKVSSEKTYQYLLYPKKVGVFEIGPVTLNLNGKDERSNKVKVKVTKEISHNKSAGGSVNGTNNKERQYFIKTVVDNEAPYVGEQIIYTFRLFSRIRIRGASLDLPEFDGFWKEDLGEERSYHKVIDGMNWSVTEIRKALFPIRSGELFIPKTKLIANVYVDMPRKSRSRRGRGGFDSLLNSFFDGSSSYRMKKVEILSNPIKLTVESLPVPNDKSTFLKVVGDIELTADLSRDQLEVGESATVSIVVKGYGNIHDAKISEFKVDGFKIYEDKPTLTTNITDDGIFGVKTFKYALVAQTEGEFSISAIQMSYFDPKKKIYVQRSFGPFQLVVKGGKESNTFVSSTPSINTKKKLVKVQATDLMDIKRDILLSNQDTYNTTNVIFAFFAIIIFPFLILGWIVFNRVNLKRRSNINLIKRQKALKEFSRKIKVKNLSVDLISNSLRSYLGERLGVDGLGLTAFDIEVKFKNRLPSKLIVELQEILNRCEMGIYGGEAIDLIVMQKRVIQVVKLVEKSKG